jgi:hypothetical protein
MKSRDIQHSRYVDVRCGIHGLFCPELAEMFSEPLRRLLIPSVQAARHRERLLAKTDRQRLARRYEYLGKKAQLYRLLKLDLTAWAVRNADWSPNPPLRLHHWWIDKQRDPSLTRRDIGV